ncbi:MAG: metal ABC transporter permease [Ilumatobacteraceae bacterium]|nr:metal ABC transporter permease [Ilumatobacteraceae bacterium]
MIDPFLNNGFMQRALVAGILVSLTCAIVGTYVVLRGMAFIGDALAHGVLPGVGMATILGLPTMLGAAVGAVVMIAGVGLITARSKLSNDTAIGLLFIGLLALGVVFVSSSDSLTGDLEAILFGQFLGVDTTDLLVQTLALLAVSAISLFSARPFLLLCFDIDLVSTMGYKAQWYQRLMLFVIAATVVVSFQTVGSLLVFGMLLAPAGVGALLAKRIGSMMMWAVGTGVLSTYLGLLASYHFSWAAGASVVLTAVAIFFLALIFVSIRKSARSASA